MPTPRHKSPTPRRPPPPPPPAANAVAPDQISPTRPPLQQPSAKKNPSKSTKLFRRVKSVFRSFPVINPPCKMPVSIHTNYRTHDGGHIHGGKQMTGTLFGHRKSRVNLAIQENPRCLPMLVLELSIQTGKLLQDMGLGLVRIALESEKNPSDKTKLIDEPIWTMYCNGRKVGYAVKREPTDDDLKVMQMLHAASMGAGVLPAGEGDGADAAAEGELTYMRAHFERVVGSKDSETYYMMNPDRNSGPLLELRLYTAALEGEWLTARGWWWSALGEGLEVMDGEGLVVVVVGGGQRQRGGRGGRRWAAASEGFVVAVAWRRGLVGGGLDAWWVVGGSGDCERVESEMGD